MRAYLLITDDEGHETQRQECWPGQSLTPEQVTNFLEAEKTNFASLPPSTFDDPEPRRRPSQAAILKRIGEGETK